MQTVRISTAQNIDIDYDIASLGDRILARLIDGGVFLGVYMLFLFVSLGISHANVNNDSTTLYIVIGSFAFLVVFYDLICEIFLNGQSIGKRAMKIRVISLNGAQPTVGQYFLRWIFRLVDFTLSGQVGGLICIAVTENKQRIGDLLAGTTVIKTHPRTTLKNVAFMPADYDYKPIYKEVTLLTDADLTLIHEVLLNFKMSNNYVLLNSTAQKIIAVLSVSKKEFMNDEQFLQTVVKDYNHLTSLVEE